MLLPSPRFRSDDCLSDGDNIYDDGDDGDGDKNDNDLTKHTKHKDDYNNEKKKNYMVSVRVRQPLATSDTHQNHQTLLELNLFGS